MDNHGYTDENGARKPSANNPRDASNTSPTRTEQNGSESIPKSNSSHTLSPARAMNRRVGTAMPNGHDHHYDSHNDRRRHSSYIREQSRRRSSAFHYWNEGIAYEARRKGSGMSIKSSRTNSIQHNAHNERDDDYEMSHSHRQSRRDSRRVSKYSVHAHGSRRPSTIYNVNERRVSMWSNLAVAVVVPEELDRSRTPSPSPSPSPARSPVLPADDKPTPAWKKPFVAVKRFLTTNKMTKSFFPPKGEVSKSLTLILSAIAVFLAARVVLGQISAIGGPIFALMLLILLCLIAGQIIKMTVLIIYKYTKISVRCPPFLGMLIIGIILKNVPYNFTKTERPECEPFRLGLNSTSVLNGTSAGDHGELHAPEHGDDHHEEKEDDHHHRRRRDEPLDALFESAIDDIDFGEEGGQSVLSRAKRSSGHEVVHEESLEESCQDKFIGRQFDDTVSGILRNVCLTVILLMAGMELEAEALRRSVCMVISATIIPCLIEAAADAVLAHFILGFDWMVAFIFGFLMTGVSPAVIIPSILSLASGGYGTKKGVPTITIAVCALDDVFAIAGYGIVSGLYFNADAPIGQLAAQAPLEIIIGVVFGIFWGTLLAHIPDKHHRHVVFFRWFGLFCGGLISIFGAHLINYEGAGGLSCIIGSFLAGKKWKEQGWGDHNPITKTLARMWIILGPVIFGLIGTEIQLNKLDGATVGYGIIVMAVALLIRMFITFFSVWCGVLNWKERVFMACAWVPKATVQAALGPVFLNRARAAGKDPEVLAWGEQILTMAVICIILFAPLGAILIQSLGPLLLEPGPQDDPHGGHGDEGDDELDEAEEHCKNAVDIMMRIEEEK